MADDLAETLKQLQDRDESLNLRHSLLQARRYIAGALCAQCGEPLGDDFENVVMTDDDKTVHNTCCKGESDESQRY